MPKRAAATPSRPYKKARYGGYKSSNKRIPGNVNLGRRSIMPDSLDTNLPYCDTKTLVADMGGTSAVHVFTLNGMYDPDITGIGHQPRGFDQYCGTENSAGMYKHYLVKGTKVEITWTNYSTEPVRVGMAFKDLPTISTSGNDYMETADSTYAVLGKEGSGHEIKKLVMFWSGRRWFGKPNLDTERDIMGSNASNPTEQAYVHLWTDNMGAGIDCTTKANIKISYACGFKCPVTPAQS